MSHAASSSASGGTGTAGARAARRKAASQDPYSDPYSEPSRDPSSDAYCAAVPWSGREKAVLAAVLVLAGSMYGWEAAHAEFHGFYAVAVRSMTTGWRAFLFGALDPNASITIDKIPGFLWPQALSALAFGFHPWSLALPQAVEGLVTVFALHTAVRRWIGPSGALLAAGIFALTPVAASLFGKGLEDAMLTCLLVLAAAAWQRAVLTGRLRWLLLCGCWVGLAFQAKMLQSWAVLPAFGFAYLIAAPPRLRTRIRHALTAGALCVAVSLSWVLIATLTPAADRPYVDGSTDNSAFAMVFGYNGLARFGSLGVSAAGTGSVSATQGSHFGASGTTGWLKLFEHELASQIGWLYPVAAAGIAFGLWRRGRGRADRVRAGTLMWTGWLLTTGLALSAGSVPHSTYVVALAPPLAALSAYALLRAVRLYRTAETAAGRLALPALTAVTLGWAARLSAGFPAFLPGIAFPLAALAVTAVVVTVAARRVAGGAGRIPRWTAAACCALMLAVPAVWSLSVFDAKYAGSSGNANAGGYGGGFHLPKAWLAAAKSAGAAGTAGTTGAGNTGAGAAGGEAGRAEAAAGARQATAPRRFNPFDPPASLDAAESRLLTYLADHRDGARYLVATESWGAASPYILADGAAVLPMGGFSGDADFPQPQQFTAMVDSGEVHYVLLTGRGLRFFAPATRQVHTAAAHQGTPPASPAPASRSTSAAPMRTMSTELSQIAAEVAKTCQLVPGSAYGAVLQETAPLYHCT